MHIGHFEDEVTAMQLTSEYMEAVDIFPALHKYKTEHSTVNLQKLCVEIEEFFRSVYASTRNDAERQVLKKMLDKFKSL